MSKKMKEVIRNENAVQAIVVADTFNDEFVPLSNDIPLSLFPVLNKPLLDYTLEFLSLGGVEETFLFCCNHVDAIRKHIKESIELEAGWSLTMKVNILASECCRSFGDCLRDIDAKGLLRGDFILLEPGTVSNLKLLPMLRKHSEVTKSDKGAAMTLIYQEAGLGQMGRCPQDDLLVAVNKSNRILFHKKMEHNKERKIDFPLDMFLENSEVSLRYNLKDTHIAICSSSVLPLFSDNFDYQTRDDFIKGLLIMNEELMDSTIYCQIVKGHNYGGAVTNWRNYQAISQELKNRWIYPSVPPLVTNRDLKKCGSVIDKNVKVPSSCILNKTIISENVTLGENVRIENSFIWPNCKIENNVIITLSIIGPNSTIKTNSKVTAGSILGKNVVIEKGKFVENTLVQSTKPKECESSDVLGKNAYRLRLHEDEEDLIGSVLSRKLSRLHIDTEKYEDSDFDGIFSDSDDDELSYTHSPVPDDTKLFFTEVIDSLTRGFEDQLLCDNLILEINSSRYAYNVTVKEVNFNVIKAILHMSLKQPIGPQYFSQLVRLLSYFSPILKNYIRNEDAMLDCLLAIQDVSTTNEELNEKWVMFVLKFFYDKDYISEDSILEWANTLDAKSRTYSQVKPFIDWLQEAEEDSDESE